MEKVVEKRSETSQQPIAADTEPKCHPNTLCTLSMIGLKTYILRDRYSSIDADLTPSVAPIRAKIAAP